MTSISDRDSHRRVLSGGIITLVSQASVMILSLLAQRIILSTLSKEDNGELFLVRRTVELFSLLLIDAGFNPGALREVSRDRTQQQTILSTIGLYRIAVWIVLVSALIVYELAVGADPTGVVLWACYLLVAGRASLLRYMYEIPQRSEMRFVYPLLYMVLDSALLTVGVYLYQDVLSPTVVLAIFAVSVVPGMILQAFATGWRLISFRHFRVAVLKQHVHLAFPVWITLVLMVVHDRLDALVLSMFAGKEAVGIYGAAYQMLVPFTTTLPVAAGSVLLPIVARLSQSDPKRASMYVATVVRILIAAGLVIASVSSIFVPDLILLMTSNVYADDALVFTVLLWSMAPIFIITYAIETMNAYGHQRLNIRIVATLALATVLSGVVVIPMYDALGASITKLVAVVVAGAMAVVLVVRVINRTLRVSLILRLVVAAAVCVALAEALPLAIHRYIAGPTTLLCSGAAMFLLGIVRVSDLRLIIGARTGESV